MTSGQRVAALFCVGLVGWMAMRSSGKAVPSETAVAPAVATAAPEPAATALAPAAWSKLTLRDIALDWPGQPDLMTTTETDDGDIITRHDSKVERSDLIIRAAYVQFPGPLANAAVAADASAEFVLKKTREGGTKVTVVSSKRRIIAGMPGRDIYASVSANDAGDDPYLLRAAYFYQGPYVYEVVAMSAPDSDGDEDAVRAFATLRAAKAPDPVAPRVAVQRLAPSLVGQPIAASPVAQPWVSSSPPGYYGNSAPAPEYHGPVNVNGYFRKNGTYVQPHTRSAPHRR